MIVTDAEKFEIGEFANVQLIDGKKYWVGVNTAEMKTALGLPKQQIIIYPTIYVASGGANILLMSVRLNTTSNTPTITKGLNGKYTIDLIDTAFGFSAAYSELYIYAVTSNVKDVLPTDFTMEVNLVGTNYFEIQFKENGVNTNLPDLTYINLLIDVKRYI